MALALLTRSCRAQAPLLMQTVKFSTFPNTVKKSLLTNAGITNVIARKTPSLNIVRKVATTQTLRSSGGGAHATLWTVERGVAVGMLAIIPTALAFPSQAMDTLLSISVVMHVHWGLDAIVTDYVRPVLVGNVIPKLAHGLVLLFSVATLGGLFYVIYNDVGVAKAIRKLWAIKGQ